MAHYLQWNTAIIKHALAQVEPGDAVYLSVDQDFVVAAAGQHLRGKLELEPLADLLQAVRQRCLDSEGRITLGRCTGLTKQENCKAAAFLAVLVLAAFEMGNMPNQGQLAYFNHLRRLLGLEPATEGLSRPPGMSISHATGIAPEEPLWEGWNKWLLDKGYVPTAVRGSGPNTYTRYAVSQTLLRAADTNILRRFFAKHHLSQRLGISWEKEDVLDVIQAESQRTPCALSSHVIRVLAERDEDRVADLRDAIYRVYETMDWDLEVLRKISKGTYTQRNNIAGGRLRGELVCFRDSLDGSFEFAVRVKLPEGLKPSDVVLQVHGKHNALHGFLGASWALLALPDSNDPSFNGEFPIINQSHWRHLYVPPRKFWLLKQRPESLDTYTADGNLVAGEEILLICANELVPRLQDWKNLGQMDWNRKVAFSNGWSAYWKFVVLSDEIMEPPGASDDIMDFVTACQHSNMPAILLSGGLRDPNGAGWLQHAMPSFTVVGTDTPVRVIVSSADRDCPLCEMCDVLPGIPNNIQLELPAGVYALTVRDGKRHLARKPFRILRWELLSPGRCDTSIAAIPHLCGKVS